VTGIAGAPGAEPLPGLHRSAVRLEQFSIGWMVIEAGVAVTAGLIAGSLALTSFGFDSVIELVSASLVLGRLRAELRGGRANEQAERRVLRIIAITFFVLAAYVLAGSVIDLATQAHPERSPAGIGLTVASLLVMPVLGWRKRRVGSALRNPLVQADAAETILCATLAATTDPARARPVRRLRLVAGRSRRRPGRRMVRGTRRPRSLAWRAGQR
jgi:predicted Co/Zn/Cd cation transporter (cation efflux family)